MNSNVMLWLDALESGSYIQARGALGRERPSGIECCCSLGVACEVYRQQMDNAIPKQTMNGVIYYDNKNSELPKSVMDWLGLTEEGQRTIIDLNDEQGYTFSQIATYIKANEADLFEAEEEEDDDNE